MPERVTERSIPIMSGYSRTHLAKKLSLKDGHRVLWHAMPQHVQDEINSYGLELTPVQGGDEIDAAHIFVTETSELAALIAELRSHIAQNGMIWVSWPKKASKRPTDITEDTIRELALSTGLVDVKVCAIDEVWSGLKLMIRKELRR
ncbi:DUF3052 family protein [Hoeflea sp. TYP-13]|uniref:DUF3052 family protein n=1 Tax=Hoeflea sp. TYP-13 TaxID=3230023 RepID=UPI0034C60FAA